MLKRLSKTANSPQLVVELLMAAHAASIISMPWIAMSLFYKPWDVSVVLSLLLARKLAVKFASATL